MFRKIRKLLVIPLVIGALLTPALVPAMVGAQDSDLQTTIKNNECRGSNLDLNASSDTDNNCQTGGAGLNDLLKNIINIFSLVVGSIAVIMIIVGGFRYVVSGGNDQATSGAKNTIIYALVGLVIVALAQFLVHFVIGSI